MKYFTLDLWFADQDLDSDADPSFEALQRYKAYLASVIEKLPVDFVVMLETICIHDANLRELQVNIEQHQVTLRLDAGNITIREGRKVKLHYTNVSSLTSTSDPEKGLAGPNGYGDLGNDEIEVLEDGEYEHRILFSSGIELNIRFRDFHLESL